MRTVVGVEHKEVDVRSAGAASWLPLEVAMSSTTPGTFSERFTKSAKPGLRQLRQQCSQLDFAGAKYVGEMWETCGHEPVVTIDADRLDVHAGG